MSKQPRSFDIDDEDDERFANDLAIGFAITMPLFSLLGLLLFDQFGLGLALGIVIGPVAAMLLQKYRRSEA